MENQVGTKQERNVAEEITANKPKEKAKYTMEHFKEYVAEREARIKCHTVSRNNMYL